MTLIVRHYENNPPEDLKEFIAGQESLENAWIACPRSDWMLWLLHNRTSYRDDIKIRRFARFLVQKKEGTEIEIDFDRHLGGDRAELEKQVEQGYLAKESAKELMWTNALCIAVDSVIDEIVRDAGFSAAFLTGVKESFKVWESGYDLKNPQIQDRINRLCDAARTKAQLNALKEQADDLRAMIGMDECLRRQHWLRQFSA